MPRLRPQHRRFPRIAATSTGRRTSSQRYRARVRTYEIHCGGRVVSSVRSYTPRHAVTDYLRSLGCRDDEMEAMSDDSMAWRGAVYSAVETEEPSNGTDSQPAED